MIKTKLNKKSRGLLIGLINTKVDLSPEEKESFLSQQLKAYKKLKKIIDKEFPIADMEVLKKYQRARVDSCIAVRAEKANRYNYVTIEVPPSETAPLLPCLGGCSSHWLGKEAYLLAHEIDESTRLMREKRIELKEDFAKLIRGARYFEDVCEVWEEASELRGEIVDSFPVPATINPALSLRIKTNVEARKKASAKKKENK
ncbi:MAG TPA: hypothetical protein V6C96_02555 [Vampirovibrionales bacterium]